MRSIFRASFIMMMLFIYIEISSGMNPGEKKKGKSVQIFGKTIPQKPKKKPGLVMVEDAHGQPRLYNEATGEVVDDVSTGSAPHKEDEFFQRLEALAPTHAAPITILPDLKETKRAFRHDTLHFDGDPPYEPRSAPRNHAVLMQMGHNLESDLRQYAPLPDIPESKWILETDEHGREILVPRAPRHLPDEPLDEQHHASTYVIPPSLRQTSPSRLSPTYFNTGEHHPWDQQGYPYGNVHHLGQGYVAENDPNRFIQGHDGPHQAIPGLPLNTQFSGSSAHHSNQGSYWYYGPGHQE